MSLVANQLKDLVSCDELKSIPLLIFSNKQDLTGAMTPEEIEKMLGLKQLNHKNWYIQPCSAKTGDGVFQGIDQFLQMLRS